MRMGAMEVILTTLMVATSWVSSVTSGSDGYSFRFPGRSYMEYRPHWNNLTLWGFGFSFRTHKANTFLFYHEFLQEDKETLQSSIEVKLKKGQLYVIYAFEKEIQETVAAKGLSHDHWHEAHIDVDLNAGNITVTVDKKDAKVISLSQDILNKVKVTFNSKPRVGVASLGGFAPNSMHTPSHFVGCMKSVQFWEAGKVVEVVFDSKDGVDLGCVDLCDHDNPCLHNGRCVNHYTRTSCDCFGTGYEGKHCNKEGGTTVTLQGSEFISYIIYDSCARSHSPVNKVALEFKTRAPEGVLFFGYSQTQYNHLAVSIHNASLHVSVVFVDQTTYDEIWLSIGNNLNDDRFHRVVVNHRGQDVFVTLDSQTEKMTAQEGHQHLHMDPAIYFGGLETAHSAMGLRSQKNFVGCLRSLYFNHNPVLEKLGGDRAKYHGNNVIYGCQDMSQTILQFTHQGAFIKVEHSTSDRLEVVMEFRSLKPDSVLLYTETSSGGDKGYIQILLRGGQIEVMVVPSVTRPKIRQAASIGENLNDNMWHVLEVLYEKGTTEVEVDGEQSLASFPWDISVSQATFLGFGPDTQMKYGYVGCMKNVRIQGGDVDPVEVIHSQLGVGVTLGPCDIHDWCHINGSHCLNQGICVSEWSDTYCDCSHVQFEGRYCQFAKLHKSCEDLYKSGHTQSGVWPVDLDGSGPLPPTHVYCEMGQEGDDRRKHGVTWVSHNLQPGTPIRRKDLQDHRKLISYREMTASHLQALVDLSQTCQQWIHINCTKSPLRLGTMTWLISAGGLEFYSLGGDTEEACGCFEEHDCVNPNVNCNCDLNSGKPLWDGGSIHNKSHLPVTELGFKQYGGLGQANITMGPLHCSGTSGDSVDAVVTVMESGAYLELAGWKGGTIDLSFHTLESDALLLYQPGTNDLGEGNAVWNNAQLYVFIRQGDLIVVQMGKTSVWQTVKSSQMLNTGRWQHLSIETSRGQLRVRINSDNFLFDYSGINPAPKLMATKLYLAGKPNLSNSEVQGFVGCLRGLTYNGHVHKLAEMAENKRGLMSGCNPSCASNPCQNGAQCQEHWKTYTCLCANKYAHSGHNCENNINENMVSFVSEESFLKLLITADPTKKDLFTQDIVFSFRTHQERALIMYLHDHLNNFLEAEVGDADLFTVRYNCGDEIVEVNVTVASLADGQWKQVAVLLRDNAIIIKVQDSAKSSKFLWTKLTQYTQVPFKQEMVGPFRRMEVGTSGYTFYLGGASSVMTNLPGLKGCIRGFQIGKKLFDLRKASEEVEGVTAECPIGCASSPCVHGGECIEGAAFTGHYDCECSRTGYAGAFCDQEVGLYFDGESYLTQTLETKADETSDNGGEVPRAGYTESIHFNFATYSTEPRARAMFYATSASSGRDFLLIYLTPQGQVAAQYSFAGKQVLVESDVQYTSGWPHHVTLTRDHAHIILRVDHSIVQYDINITEPLEAPVVLSVGGVSSDDGQLSVDANFTGDISNVFLLSDWLVGVSGRPLDDYHGYTDSQGAVVVQGSVRPATQALGGGQGIPGPMMFNTAPRETSPQMFSFPPSKMGPAQTINILYNTDDKTSHNAATDIVGILVCVAMVMVFASGIFCMIWRARRNKARQEEVTPGGNDEEEGLITLSIDMEGEVSEEIKENTERSSKYRQGRRQPKLLASVETLDGDEDEETPMLLSVENPAAVVPQETMEITNYNKMMNEIPMIDDDDDDEEEKINEERGGQDEDSGGEKDIEEDTVTLTDENSATSTDNSSRTGDDTGVSLTSSSALEWDHRADVSSPLVVGNGDEMWWDDDALRNAQNFTESESSPDVMRSTPGRKQHLNYTTDSALPLVVGTPGLLDSPNSTIQSHDPWTESQVLDLLDSEGSEPSWDPAADGMEPLPEDILEQQPLSADMTPTGNPPPIINSSDDDIILPDGSLMDSSLPYNLTGMKELSDSGETFRTAFTNPDHNRLSLDVDALEAMIAEENINNSNVQIGSDISLPQSGAVVTQPSGKGHMTFGNQSDSDTDSVESFNSIQSEPDTKILDSPLEENVTSADLRNTLQPPLEPEVIVTANAGHESDEELFMATDANKTVVSSSDLDNTLVALDEESNVVPSDDQTNTISDEENCNTQIPSSTNVVSGETNDDVLNNDVNDNNETVSNSQTDHTTCASSSVDCESDTSFPFDKESLEESSESLDDVDDLSGSLLTPEGLDPIRPPPGKSPGIPHNSGRMKIKQAKSKGKKQS